MENVETTRFTWVVNESFGRDQLFAFLSAWSSGQILRRTPNRCVRLVHADAGALVVKRFYHPGIRGVLKALLAGTPAARQWKALVAARQTGLPSPCAIALGEEKGIFRGESLLAVQFLKNTEVLAEALLDQRLGAKRRRELVHEVAALVRKAHDLGFYLPDLHAKNILIKLNGAHVEAYLIDLQGVSERRSLEPAKRWKNLAVFHGGCTEASQTERLRFLKHYLSQPAPLPFDLRRLTAELDAKGRRHRNFIWQRRQTRCVRENRDFVRVQAPPFCGFARKACWDNGLSSLLREPGPFLRGPGTRLVKDSKTTTVAVAGETPARFYIKRYNYQGVAYAAKDFFRSSRARRTWIAANSLEMRGIPVARPLLYLERRRLGFLLESYILTQAIAGVMLRDIFRRYDAAGYRIGEKRTLLGELARFLKKMHRNGVAHRDLKGTNFMVQETAGENYDFHIVDFDGIRLGPLSWHRRIKNLARLGEECHRHCCFTYGDRLRFLKVYLGAEEAKAWKTVWRTIAKRSRRRVVSAN
ncbi:MAG: lipopolysaccharide kinase InaA family protein [Candidatus Binatia bacterium]